MNIEILPGESMKGKREGEIALDPNDFLNKSWKGKGK